MIPVTVSHTILWHIECASQAYVQSYAPDWLPATQVYRGAENRDVESMEGEDSSMKKRPCVVLSCQTSTPIFPPAWVGLWTATLKVGVEINRAKNDGDSTDCQASQIFDLFYAPELNTKLASYVDGMAIQSTNPVDLTRRSDGRAWIYEHTFSIEQVKRKVLWRT